MEDQVEEIKQKADIVSIVGERVALVRSGRNFKALCPFHGERTPSFMVSPELGIYKCFGCGRAGDVYSFLQEYEGMEFPEALSYLADRVGVRLRQVKRDRSSVRRKRLFEITHLASEYYHYLLTSHEIGKKARGYLVERGVQKRSIEKYKLGFAPESWDSLLRYLTKKKGYRVQDLEAVGLVARRRGFYDRFRKRIIFPLRDARGNVVGFSGRLLPGDESGERGGKYINSPETELYHKSENVYGLHENRALIKKRDQVVVVEGELDVISSWQVGVKQVVAVKGTAFTKEQVALIRRYTRNMVLALDADSAGDKATKRSIGLADSSSVNVRVAILLGGKDPDQVAQSDRVKWKKLVNEAVSVYDFYIKSAKKRFDLATGLGKKQAAEEVVPLLFGITNAVEQAHYIKKFAKVLGVSDESVADEIRRHERSQAAGVSKISGKADTADDSKDRGRRVLLEEYLLTLVLQAGKKGVRRVSQKTISDFGHVGIKEIFERLVKGDLRKFEVGSFIQKLPAELKELAQNAFMKEVEGVSADPAILIEEIGKVKEELGKLSARERLTRISREIGRLEVKTPLSEEDEKSLVGLQKEFSKISRLLLER